MSTSPNLEDTIVQLTQELGYSVVEITISPAKFGGKKVSLYIYKEHGIGLDDCSAVASSLNLELDVLYPEIDIALNVSTPGIDRQFKSNKEYSIFINQRVHIAYKNGASAIGIISSVAENGFYLDGTETLHLFQDIARAKLNPDY
ncbi:hypothetical protein PVA45_04825 [Entomospira entomophila]|uniref:Ribosome maturation factor RimP n=1 Tax=Entomospira entomophila TaxID=2719988 RepID=A0A968GAJ4_9SPIO|nr:hypothetical protein [Entomospira entomophilus]NIZ40825.1 hypothetical protein [Entomospira entomophilus]WDI35037.1 hypothetical protein PVA45_04825 [Entomospira entomophilus]